jgi:hypothetical protein
MKKNEDMGQKKQTQNKANSNPIPERANNENGRICKKRE